MKHKTKIAICGTPLFVTEFFEYILKQDKYEIAFCLTKSGSDVEELSRVALASAHRQ